MGPRNYIVDTAWPGEPALYEADAERLRAWAGDPSARAVTVCGPPGVGKTSFVGRVLLEQGERYEGVKRVGCWPGIQPEEIVAELASFLLQIGYGRPEAALDQRLPLPAKLRVLAETMALADVLVWFDDFDLAVSEEGTGASSAQARRSLLDALVEGAAGRARFVFTGTEPILGFRSLWGEAALEFPLVGLQPEEGEALFRSLSDGPSLRWELLPASVRHLPLAVALLARVGVRLGPNAVLAIEEPGGGDLAGILDRIWDELPAATRRLVGGLSLIEEPIPAGLLRALLEAGDMGAGLEPALEWGLVRAGAPLSNRYFIHRLVRARARERLRCDAPDEVGATLRRAGDYFERLAQASRSTWDTLRARRYFFRAGAYERAYELQKEVLEDLLRRGYLELAKRILDETARTTRGRLRAVALGNLAIIHKNQGNYDRALELYHQVHREFSRLQDRANLARVLHQLGNTFYLKGAFEDAVEHYEASRKLAEEIGEHGVAAASQVQIGNIHYLRGELEPALNEYRGSLRAAREFNDAGMAVAVLLQMGQILFLRREFLEARETLEEAEGMAEEAGDTVNRVKILQLLGLVAQARQAPEEGLERLRRAADLARRLGDEEEYALSLAHMVGLELEQGTFGSAVRHLAEAAEASGEESETRNALRGLAAELQRRLGDRVFHDLAARAGAPDLPERLGD